jgi:hypothetical protein
MALFRSDYNKAQLPGLVAAVARAADPLIPERVSQSRWDAARARAGHPDVPSAKQIAARLKRAWREVLVVSLGLEDPNRGLGQREGARISNAPTEAEIRSAIGTVALRLEVRTLSQDQYDQERQRMLAAARRRGVEDRLILPTGGQIIHKAGTWHGGLVIAGLEKSPPAKGSGSRRGLSIVEALELFVEQEAAIPSFQLLKRWIHEQGIALSRSTRPYAEDVEDLRHRRTAGGLETPTKRIANQGQPGRPKKGEKKPPKKTHRYAPTRDGVVRHRRRNTTAEDCRRAITAFLEQLPSNERPTNAAYRRFCRENPGTPWPNSFERHGGWGTMIQQVLSDEKQGR